VTHTTRYKHATSSFLETKKPATTGRYYKTHLFNKSAFSTESNFALGVLRHRRKSIDKRMPSASRSMGLSSSPVWRDVPREGLPNSLAVITKLPSALDGKHGPAQVSGMNANGFVTTRSRPEFCSSRWWQHAGKEKQGYAVKPHCVMLSIHDGHLCKRCTSWKSETSTRTIGCAN